MCGINLHFNELLRREVVLCVTGLGSLKSVPIDLFDVFTELDFFVSLAVN